MADVMVRREGMKLAASPPSTETLTSSCSSSTRPCESSSRANIVRLAELAASSCQYDKMLELICAAASMKEELTFREKYLLQAACKQAVSSRRRDWQVCWDRERDERSPDNAEHVDGATLERLRVLDDLTRLCQLVIGASEHQILVSADSESLVFYKKLSADHWRYIAYVAEGGMKIEALDKALACYQSAASEASVGLSPVHPLRVAVLLNYAVFNYEVLEKQQDAVQIARNALDDVARTSRGDIQAAVTQRSDLYTEAESSVQLLRENLAVWEAAVAEDPADATPAVSEPQEKLADSEACVSLDFWTNAGQASGVRMKNVVGTLASRLVANGVALPDNITLLGSCTEASNIGYYLYRFGTRQLHVTMHTAQGGGLILVVRCGGGFQDFASFARRHGRAEQMQLQRQRMEQERDAQGQRPPKPALPLLRPSSRGTTAGSNLPGRTRSSSRKGSSQCVSARGALRTPRLTR